MKAAIRICTTCAGDPKSKRTVCRICGVHCLHNHRPHTPKNVTEYNCKPGRPPRRKIVLIPGRDKNRGGAEDRNASHPVMLRKVIKTGRQPRMRS